MERQGWAPLLAAERSVRFAELRRLTDEGIRALQRQDPQAAIESFRRAHALAVEEDFGVDVTCGTLLNLALAYNAAGDFQAALAAYRAAADLPHLDDEQRAAIFFHMGTLYGRWQDYRQAVICCARAYRLARRAGTPAARVRAAADVAYAYRSLVTPRAARRAYRWAQRAVRDAEGADAPTRQLAALRLGAAALDAGHARVASAVLARLAEDALPAEHRSELYRLRAEVALRKGDRDAALQDAARAADLAVASGSPEDLDQALGLLGRVAGGRWALAEPARVREAVQACQGWVSAFGEAAEQAGVATGEGDPAVLLADRRGLILARAGGGAGLAEATRRGLVVGASTGLPQPPAEPAYAWSPVTSEPEPPAYVLTVPAVPALARSLAALLAHLQRSRDLERREAEQQLLVAKLTAFHDAALSVGRPLGVDELAPRLLAHAREAVAGSAAALVFLDRTGVWTAGLPPAVVAQLPVVARVAASGRSTRLAADTHPEELRPLGVASLIAVPVFFGTTRCGAVLMTARHEGAPFGEREVELLTFISKLFGLALENALLRDDLRRRLHAVTQELAVAQRLQAALMPARSVRAEGIAIAGATLPAKHVGGDLFDYAPLPDGSWVVVLGDVMGKGVAAAMLGSILLARVRQLIREVPFGPGLVERLAAAMWDDLSRARALATLCLVRADPRRSRLTVLAAGHHGPLCWQDGAWHVVSAGGGTALGLRPDGGGVARFDVPLRAGAVFLVYSDGLGELLLGRRGLLRGDGVATCLTRLGITPEAGAERLLDRVRELAEGRELTDDVTAVALAVEGAAGPDQGGEPDARGATAGGGDGRGTAAGRARRAPGRGRRAGDPCRL